MLTQENELDFDLELMVTAMIQGDTSPLSGMTSLDGAGSPEENRVSPGTAAQLTPPSRTVSPEALVAQVREEMAPFVEKNPAVQNHVALRLQTLSDTPRRPVSRPRLVPVQLFQDTGEAPWSPLTYRDLHTPDKLPTTPSGSPFFCFTPISAGPDGNIFNFPSIRGSSSPEFCPPSGTPVKCRVTRRGPNIVYRREHVRAMSEVFQTTAYPDREQKEELARTTGLPVKLIQSWFKNARRRERRTASREQDSDSASPSPPNSAFESDTDSVFFPPHSPEAEQALASHN